MSNPLYFYTSAEFLPSSDRWPASVEISATPGLVGALTYEQAAINANTNTNATPPPPTHPPCPTPTGEIVDALRHHFDAYVLEQLNVHVAYVAKWLTLPALNMLMTPYKRPSLPEGSCPRTQAAYFLVRTMMMDFVERYIFDQVTERQVTYAKLGVEGVRLYLDLCARSGGRRVVFRLPCGKPAPTLCQLSTWSLEAVEATKKLPELQGFWSSRSS
ncbi:hypothetical protein CVT24_001574 [Panaeolus cyanescens]|uniref:Uncharacterized protein n=1 Tax=Panaeolus cyanescens TaxID=181874 RepID=A0A409YYV6_9AGAR|nr:hypothetical protein CVT24_001574 [Panaeolus cyanescens]